MNILCINHEYPPIGGGGGTACRYTAREYAALGNNVTVVTAAFENTPDYEVINGVKIHRLKCRRIVKDHSTFSEMLSFMLAALRYAPQLLKKEKIDIIHIFFGIPSGPVGWYLLKRYKVPYVVRLGGGDIPGTQNRFKTAYAVLGPFLKAVWRNAVCVVANSAGLRERAERYYAKARFTVVHNGVALSNYPAEKIWRAKGQGIFNITTSARIVERKGIQHVIRALPRLVKETGGDIRYTVIGDGPYKREVEALAESLGVSEYVEITGMIPFKRVVEKLSEADVFVLTSHWEGMPNAVLEAMASHLPVIMSNCEGSVELVDRNGYILEMNENIADVLAEKLLILHKDRALLAEMGRNSYERVKEHFTWDKTAKAYLELFDNAIMNYEL